MMDTELSDKLCECGCGLPTIVAPRTQKSEGYSKGDPKRFRKGHNARKHPYGEPVALRRRRQRYGLELDDIIAILQAQGFRCGNKACGKMIGVEADIDHDHETGQVRGLLCPQCNRAAGLAKDSPDVLRGLAAYLEG